MKLGNKVETTQQGNFKKIAGKVGASLALVGVLSSQPVNADWINAQDEERCEISRNLYRTGRFQIITCEGGIAYTHTSDFYYSGKTVKLDKTGKPQKCICDGNRVFLDD